MNKLKSILIRWLGGIPSPVPLPPGVVAVAPVSDQRTATAPAKRQELFDAICVTIGAHAIKHNGRDPEGRAMVMADEVLDVTGALIGQCLRNFPGDKSLPMQIVLSAICKQADLERDDLGLATPSRQAEERPSRLH